MERLVRLSGPERLAFLDSLEPADRLAMMTAWRWQARPSQLAPKGDWGVWLIMAGRGFGKTRAGAEWVTQMALEQPGARIALVGATAHDCKSVMLEGESGLLAVAPDGFKPLHKASKKEIRWPNGSVGCLFSAVEPDSLRGPQFNYAWCDEIAAWSKPKQAWDNLRLGMRLGDRPRAVVTTTPRPLSLLKQLLADPTVQVSRGSTYDNRANLPAAYLGDLQKSYGASAIGRQEVLGEFLEEREGALWSSDGLDACREVYTQQDVVEVALAMTGWSVSTVSIDRPYYGQTLRTTPGAFIFQPSWHEPGSRTVMGTSYPQVGEDQLVAIVTDICLKPACAEFLARKISRHFLREDGNDAELVAALKAAYLGSGGELFDVYQALIATFDPAKVQAKIKSPSEWIVSIGRAIGGQPPSEFLAEAVSNSNQDIWSPGSPAGWPDSSSYWFTSQAMVNRAIAVSKLLSKWPSLPSLEAVVTASQVAFTETTLTTAQAQTTAAISLALLFCSPEFMRR